MNEKNFETLLNYLDKMKRIQEHFLRIIEINNYTEFDELIVFLNEQKINENKDILKDFLYLIAKITQNHHMTFDYFFRMEKLLSNFKEPIKNSFTSFEIFDIFKDNQRLLCYLFDDDIIIPNHEICSVICNEKYSQLGYHYHFFPEFRQFYSESVLNDIKTKNPLLPLIQIDVLKRNRREYRGEPFYQIIQNDSIDEFAKCVFKNVTSLNSKIEKKFHEINQFLIPGLHSLIEYAAFYGSVQIFQYLISNGAELTSDIWKYAIHSQNLKMIQILIENHVELPINECCKEAIKCHHNDILKYFLEFFYESNEEDDFNLLIESIKSFNFAYCSELTPNEINKPNQISKLVDFVKDDYSFLNRFFYS